MLGTHDRHEVDNQNDSMTFSVSSVSSSLEAIWIYPNPFGKEGQCQSAPVHHHPVHHRKYRNLVNNYIGNIFHLDMLFIKKTHVFNQVTFQKCSQAEDSLCFCCCIFLINAEQIQKDEMTPPPSHQDQVVCQNTSVSFKGYHCSVMCNNSQIVRKHLVQGCLPHWFRVLALESADVCCTIHFLM